MVALIFKLGELMELYDTMTNMALIGKYDV